MVRALLIPSFSQITYTMNYSSFLLHKTTIFILALSLLAIPLSAQSPPVWDNPETKGWLADFQEVQIPSSLDGSLQSAYFLPTPASEPQPLIVSLHTWSGNYQQEDRLSGFIYQQGWNYIHPDFRGPNTRPEACGSPYVRSDIEDAIRFAIQQGKVDTTQIHVIGASGGGYATLMLYMHTQLKIKSFSAWVPISNLEEWYWSSASRKLKYARHILQATSSIDSTLKVEEARKRSPVYQSFPKEARAGSSLHIYHGIHDGHKGNAVPISQSTQFFNKLMQELEAPDSLYVSDGELAYMLAQRSFEPYISTPKKYLADRFIHYQKSFQSITLSIFEGRHEMVLPAAVANLKVQVAQSP